MGGVAPVISGEQAVTVPRGSRARRASGRFPSILENRKASQAAVIVVVVVAWEIIGRAARSPVIPAVSDIMVAWGTLLVSSRFQADMLVTLQTLAAGFGLALVSGVLVGVAMARFRMVEVILDPYISAMMSAPHSAMVPIIMLLLGLQTPARIAVVFLYCFFIICVNTFTGVKYTNVAYLSMARAFGANDRQIFTKVALPGAVPLVLGGIRLSIGRAAGGVLLAEILMALTGIGYQLQYYSGAFLTSYVYAIIGTISLLALILTESVYILERRLTRWYNRPS